MPTGRTRVALIAALLIAAACAMAAMLAHSAADKRPAYRQLKELAQGPRQAATVVVCQRRTGISKLFITGGSEERRHLRVTCDTAQLVLRRENGISEWVEEMEEVEAQWQEALYATPPLWCYQLPAQQPCQLVRQFNAARALYYPRRHTILAGEVFWQHMLAAGHDLPSYASNIMQRGYAAEIAVQPYKGGMPHWRARGLSLEESMWLP